MNQNRFNFFSSLPTQEKFDLNPDFFTVSECEEIIKETPLSSVDRKISHFRFIDKMTISEIADRIGIDNKTCNTRINKLIKSFKSTCAMMFACTKEDFEYMKVFMSQEQ